MQYTANNFFDSMKDKTIDVIGIAISNTELAYRLAQSGANVTARDMREESQIRSGVLDRLKEGGVKLKLGTDYLKDLNGEIIFRTPGMNFFTPELTNARKRGQIVTSEIELFVQLCPCLTFGITGSDGKTTTSTLIAEMLKMTGKNVHLGGNIGKPLLPIVDKISVNDYCVIELSSFQLISMRSSPDIAVITNMSPNHLDVHKNLEEYFGAKKNIIAHQSAFGKAVLSAYCQNTAQLADMVRGKLSWFSRAEEVENGGWLDKEGYLNHSVNGKFVRLLHKSEIPLPGIHNVENVLAAASAVWGIVSPKDIAAVAKRFCGVEHRIEFVRKLDGVRWYNDSIATTPTRTCAGLLSFEQKLIVIAGGYDKLIPFDPLAKPMNEHAKVLILTGPTATKIEATVTSYEGYNPENLKIIHATDLPEAVKIARSLAKDGDVVTLSPACASFDAYQNFEERGKHFKQLVNDLK